MCKKQHKDIFYAFNGPGPYICTFCDGTVLGWWDEPDGHDGRQSHALVVHHVDHNHTNNAVENLAASHYGCHTSHHFASDPLVPKGSTLPEEWKRRVALGTTKRMAEMTVEEKQMWLERVLNGMHKVDKTPILCDCGSGPFRGEQGLKIHRARSCSSTGGNAASKAKQNRKPFHCECGKGPFSGRQGLAIHRQAKTCVL